MHPLLTHRPPPALPPLAHHPIHTIAASLAADLRGCIGALSWRLEPGYLGEAEGTSLSLFGATPKSERRARQWMVARHENGVVKLSLVSPGIPVGSPLDGDASWLMEERPSSECTSPTTEADVESIRQPTHVRSTTPQT